MKFIPTIFLFFLKKIAGIGIGIVHVGFLMALELQLDSCFSSLEIVLGIRSSRSGDMFSYEDSKRL